jgi:hypothetical protein
MLMFNEQHMLINLNNTNSIQELRLNFGNVDRQKPHKLSLNILLGSKIELSFIDDTILLIESENCEIRLDMSKSDLMKLKQE